ATSIEELRFVSDHRNLQSTPSGSLQSLARSSPNSRPAAHRANGQPAGRLSKRLVWVALVLWLIGSVGITCYARHQRSGWARMTFPGDGRFANMPLLGQNFLQGQDPFFYENWSMVEQIAFFSGWRGARLDHYCFRPFPAFVAALWTPVVGPI